MNGDMFPEVVMTEDNDKRYSTLELMAHAERLTGVSPRGWHLDVAADAQSHWAPLWYVAPGASPEDSYGAAGVDGLKQPWFKGLRVGVSQREVWNVWANIPFSDPRAWLEKAWQEVFEPPFAEPVLCMVLPSDRTDKPWWQELVETRRDGRDDALGVGSMMLTTHHLPGRIKYGLPGNPKAVGVGQPMFGTTLLVWRRRWW